MFRCRVLGNRKVKIKTGLFLVVLLPREWCEMREVILGLVYLFVWFVCCVLLGWVFIDEGTMLAKVPSACRPAGTRAQRSPKSSCFSSINPEQPLLWADTGPSRALLCTLPWEGPGPAWEERGLWLEVAVLAGRLSFRNDNCVCVLKGNILASKK